ncbi:Casein kinase I isoform alpha [Acropora cervicornis]|uniref:non-specific serine/threonine protein kinase n=1 Tax=Acropora cervicornis TaxID=6130 RepID=A0AAD9UZJ6_ACRCE|nr:Casein kinase I isoform alpha [Acropora cervicornis]
MHDTPIALTHEIQEHPKKIFIEMIMFVGILRNTFKDGFPQVFWSGQKFTNNVLVMELLGENLDYLLHKKSGPGTFTLKSVIQLAYQMIDRIKFVHENDYLHRDIKPENFLMGRRDKKNTVYLIDFGLAKKYRDRRVSHIRFRQKEKEEITGTARYASVNAHKGMELSRRDDLESVGYLLVYFLRGSLPWQGLQARNDRERYKLITEKKLSVSVEKLCQDFPNEFKVYLDYCRALKFEEEPDYEYLKELFRQLASKLNVDLDSIFDWNQETLAYKPKTDKQKEETKE